MDAAPKKNLDTPYAQPYLPEDVSHYNNSNHHGGQQNAISVILNKVKDKINNKYAAAPGPEDKITTYSFADAESSKANQNNGPSL